MPRRFGVTVSGVRAVATSPRIDGYQGVPPIAFRAITSGAITSDSITVGFTRSQGVADIVGEL